MGNNLGRRAGQPPSQIVPPQPADQGGPSDSMTPQRSQESVEDIGLSVLAAPEHPVADVVLLHGLQGHPRKTWTFTGPVRTSKPAGEPTQAKETQRCFDFKKQQARISVFWPQALLPHDRKDVRVLTYGYDSQITKGCHRTANKMNLYDHGRTFLRALAVNRSRSNCQNRPLIFVAHSLGGLIVKEALRLSWEEKYHKELQSVYRSTLATIFFGTPHRGSEDAAWGDAIRWLTSLTQNDTTSVLLDELNPAYGGSKLDELSHAFSSMLSEKEIKVYTFVEAEGKVGCGCLSKQVSKLMERLWCNLMSDR